MVPSYQLKAPILIDLQNRILEDIKNQGLDGENKTLPWENANRVKLFLSSLEYGLASIGLFKDIFDNENLQVGCGNNFAYSRKLLKRVFGPKVVERLTKVDWIRAAFEAEEYTAGHLDEIEGDTSAFWDDVLAKGDPDKSLFMADLYASLDKMGPKTRHEIFNVFYRHLKESAFADSEEKFKKIAGRGIKKNGLPTWKQVEKSSFYLSRRIGPTFCDLKRIMTLLWDKYDVLSSMGPREIHLEISKLVDEQVDAGHIVPALNPLGQRIFRKGEGSFLNRLTYRFCKLHGISPDLHREYSLEALKDVLESRGLYKTLKSTLEYFNEYY